MGLSTSAAVQSTSCIAEDYFSLSNGNNQLPIANSYSRNYNQPRDA